jgi:ketosteroid isomerase-like protein
MTDAHAFPDPAEHVTAYCAAFAEGSGSQLDRLYEPGAVLVPRPGTPLVGPARRIPAHEHLLGFGLPITAHTRHAYVTGDIALLVVDWSIAGTGRAGQPVDLRGTAADVARLGPDGRWRYVIDNPFGTA